MNAQAESILEELAALFTDYLALGSWGRIIVSLATRKDGSFVVDDLMVEEVIDEEAVDHHFQSPEARQLMPAVAHAIVGLSALLDLDVAATGGGTFVWQPQGSKLHFLPGKVRAPSPAIDAARERVLAAIETRNRGLAARYGIGAGVLLATDNSEGTFRATVSGFPSVSGTHAVLASFSAAQCSFVWGANNPTLATSQRELVRDLLDALVDRSAWEIATPGFATDRATAWLLGAYVALESDFAGLIQLDLDNDGFVLLGIREVVESAPNVENVSS